MITDMVGWWDKDYTEVAIILDWSKLTSDICVAVLPMAPRDTMARAEEMLRGE